MAQQVFTSSGTFTPAAGVTTVSVLVVAGGGGGGTNASGIIAHGGGGAGGVRWVTGVAVTAGVGCAVTVGGGGAGGSNIAGGAPGTDGGSSSFVGTSTTVSCTGGGGGGAASTSNPGRAGGSGGGAASTTSAGLTGGAGTTGEGNTGGAGYNTSTTSQRAAGGGGGAGAVGTAGTANTPGAGGAGSNQSANVGTGVGVSGWFGGGGGGGGATGTTVAAAGGQGGGGTGGRGTNVANPTAGTANTGGGGGGGGNGSTAGVGAAGGSGIVIVVYELPPNVPTSVAAGTITTTTIDLSWSAPSGGGPVTSYDVRLNGGTPVTGVTSPYTFTGLTAGTTYTLEVRAVGPGGTSSWVSTSATTLEPPGPPTSVVAVPDVDFITLSWSAPASGGSVTSYDVRLDGGTPVTGVTSPYVFTGLTPVTGYTVSVRAVGPGGAGSWVDVPATTVSAAAWRADIRVGAHTWTCLPGDVADPDAVNVLAGAAFTWAAPDDAGWPPPVHVTDRDVLTLRLFASDAADFGDIRKGDLVRFKFTAPAGGGIPIVDFAGRARAVSVEDRLTSGAFLQVTAADHLVTLQDWSIPGETLISTDGDTQAEVLDRIAYVLNAIEAAQDRDMIPGSFGDPLNVPDEPHFAGTVSDDYTIPADQFISAFDLFARYGMGMMPVPQYDDDTGELDPAQPFVIEYMDPYGQDYLTSELDACLIPTTSVDWQRDYTPNVLESDAGLVWAGETYSTPLPDYDLWRLLRTGDPFPDVNTAGLMNELEEPGPWGPYTFTVLAWQAEDPSVFAGWLTVPDRWRTYVTMTGIDPLKNPNGDDAVSGMLRAGTWSMGTDGRWTIDAGIRRSRGHTDDD